MTAERLYVTVLALYPSAFRREYGEAMVETARRLDADYPQFRVALWWWLAADLARSLLVAQIDACRTGTRRFALEWTAACACGAALTALAANAMTWTFGYFYHPYLEGVTVPPWSYGLLLGAGLGGVQVLVLARRSPLGLLWMVATAVGTALGLEAAIAVAQVAGVAGYALVLGGAVGVSQWIVLRPRLKTALWSVLVSGAALSVPMSSCAARLHTTFAGLTPLGRNPLAVQPGAYDAALALLSRGLYGPATLAEFAIELAVMVMCGLVIAVLTVKPIGRTYAHPASRRHPLV